MRLVACLIEEDIFSGYKILCVNGSWGEVFRGRSRTAATSKIEHFVIIVNG